MKQITAADFEQAVELDPAWASKLSEPVEITGYVDMLEGEITHLSPLLHFTGRNNFGDVANFNGCKNLKVAEGNFDGWVGFSESGVEKIGDIRISQANNLGYFFSLEITPLWEENPGKTAMAMLRQTHRSAIEAALKITPETNDIEELAHNAQIMRRTLDLQKSAAEKLAEESKKTCMEI